MFRPANDSSAFADAYCDWLAHERNPGTSEDDTTLDLYSAEELDEFASVANSKLACPAFAADPGLLAFVRDCRKRIRAARPAFDERAHPELRALNVLGLHRDLGGCTVCRMDA